jgi:hypothetical protein
MERPGASGELSDVAIMCIASLSIHQSRYPTTGVNWLDSFQYCLFVLAMRESNEDRPGRVSTPCIVPQVIHYSRLVHIERVQGEQGLFARALA